MSKEKFVRDKPHVTLGIIIAILGIFTATSTGVVMYIDVTETADSDGDGIADHLEERSKRPLFFGVADDLLTFSSYEGGTSPTSGNHEVGHNLGLSHDGLSSYVEIHSRLYDDLSTGIPVLEFGIKYDSLIEFVDSDSNGYFEPAMDTVVGKTLLTNLLRVEFGYGVDGQPSYYSRYSTLDEVFKVDFYTSREHVLLGRQVGLLAPDELKSVLTITNYSPITGGTSLALNLSLSSSHNLIFSSSGLEVKTSTGAYEVEYEWLDWAIIGGMSSIVNTTVPKTAPSMSGDIYINFGDVINVSYYPRLMWSVPIPGKWNIFDLPWNYIAMGSIGLLMAATTAYIVRKRPGRTTYQPMTLSTNSTETTTDGEKRIPETLRHRDR
ncbi:MAG: hypothetical protein ACW986_07480 [Promethearchaeota archaeon]|jgi:hypothetical protein